MITVSIVNVTSYTGLELLRLLINHPEFVVTSVTARSFAGQRLGTVFSQLSPGLNHQDSTHGPGSLMIAEKAARTDLAFVCLPHAAAAETVIELLNQGIKVVDLSADFRLRDAAIYEQWYEHVHPAPALLETAVYGLCERYRKEAASAQLIANPGCHATASILALLPAISAGLIEPDIIVNTLTGISGAGRGLKLGSLYCEQDEDASAYNLDGHRHLAEITQEAELGVREGEQVWQKNLRLTFIPHLIPMSRGILATCYARLKESGLHIEELRAVYANYYAHEPFIRVTDTPPHTKWTTGTNLCMIYPTIDQRSNRLTVVSCLDNLVKGAAGQAIQNANLLSHLPETSGLLMAPLYP